MMEYQIIDQRTRSVGLDTGTSESHGIFCGLLCGGHESAESVWLTELLADVDPQDLLVKECTESLVELARDTREQIDGPELGFSPCLPDDDSDMQMRAVALRDWCRGFLYGLGLSGTHENMLGKISIEALNDMARIATLDDQDLQESEQEEQSYMELVEFLWVAAMLIYEERVAKGSQS